MTLEFEGKVAMVTGAGSGIGRGTALRLAAGGARVIVQDVGGDGARETLDLIEAAGGAGLLGIGSVANESHLAASVEAAGGTVSILVNNAGVPGFNAEIDKIDYAAYQRLFDIHVWGTIAATRAVLPGMRAARYGRILNISSNRGQVGFERSSHYCAAKAAVTGLAKAWAREFAEDGILVNALAPGVVRSGMTLRYGEDALEEEAQLNLVKRWAEPNEIAEWIAFAVGPKGSYMTGQLLCPNGGDPIVGI